VSIALGVVAIVIAALAQVAMLPAFSIFGVQPNLVIVLLVAWMAVRPRIEVLLLIPLAGMLLGLLDSQPLGLALLALAPLIALSEIRGMRLVDSDLLPAVIIVTVATLVYESVILISLALRGEQLDWLASVLDVLVPAAIASMLLLLPVYTVVRFASVDLRRRPAY
jgi:rod shape-determining protein MreD